MFCWEYRETLKNIWERLLFILWTRIEITQAKKIKSTEIYGFLISYTDMVTKKNSKKLHTV